MSRRARGDWDGSARPRDVGWAQHGGGPRPLIASGWGARRRMAGLAPSVCYRIVQRPAHGLPRAKTCGAASGGPASSLKRQAGAHIGHGVPVKG